MMVDMLKLLHVLVGLVDNTDRFHFYLINKVLSHAGLYNPGSYFVSKAVDILKI